MVNPISLTLDTWHTSINVPVIPVVIIHDTAHIAPLAEALIAGGLPIIEITLRTSVAWTAIEQMAKNYPAIKVGVGTLMHPSDAKRAQESGATFAVSPGFLPSIASACRAVDLPYLPGIVTATELMNAYHEGFRFLKFFPAQAAGGAPLVNSYSSPFADVRFCPTGGINEQTALDYLRLPNVHCIGGSWIASPQKLQAQDWAGITASARAACQLRAH